MSFEPVPATIVALVADLLDGQREQPAHLLVGERRGLAGAAADDQAVGAVLDQVVHEPDGSRLVHASLRVERGDHRGEEGAQGGHVRRVPECRGGTPGVRRIVSVRVRLASLVAVTAVAALAPASARAP